MNSALAFRSDSLDHIYLTNNFPVDLFVYLTEC